MARSNGLTVNQFNAKYKNFLEPGFYGLDIVDQDVIDYLDAEFEKEIAVNEKFDYAQIKMKFGSCRVYATSDKTGRWEAKINELLKDKE